MILDNNHYVEFYDKDFTKVYSIIFDNDNLSQKAYIRLKTVDDNGNVLGYTADNTCYILSYDTNFLTIFENGTVVREGTDEEYSEIIIKLNEYKGITDRICIISADYAFNINHVKDYLNICVIADKYSVKCSNDSNEETVMLPYFETENRNLAVNVNGGSGTFRIKNIKMMKIVEAECESDIVLQGEEYVDCQGNHHTAEQTSYVSMMSDLPAVFEMQELRLLKDDYYFDYEGNLHKAVADGVYNVRVEEITYDNGLNYRVDKNNNQIILTSKGIPFLTTQAYYVIEICHEEKLSVPFQKIQTDPEDEEYCSFVDLTQEEIQEYENDLTCRYFIRYEKNVEHSTDIPTQLNFNSRGEIKYFDLDKSIVQIPISNPDVEWCRIDNNRAFTISIECDANDGCERQCFAEINGVTITITQEAKQFLYKKDVLNFAYNDTDEATYTVRNTFSTFEFVNGNPSWCSVRRDGDNIKVRCLSNNMTPTERICTLSFKNDCETNVGLLEIRQDSKANEDQVNVKFLKIYHEGKRVGAIFIDKEGNVMESYSADSEEPTGAVPDLYKNKDYQLAFSVVSQTYLDEDWNIPITNSTISVMRGAKWLEIDKNMEYDESTDPITGEIIISSDEDNNYGVNRIGNLIFVCNSDTQLRCTLRITQKFITEEEETTN